MAPEILRAGSGIRHRAVLVAAIASFVCGGLWYSPLLLGETYFHLLGRDVSFMPEIGPLVQSLAMEFLRGVVTAYVLARLIVALHIDSWKSAARLGVWTWLGFSAMAIAGAAIHEGYSWALYLIHAGDALVKILVMSVVLSFWHGSALATARGAAANTN